MNEWRLQEINNLPKVAQPQIAELVLNPSVSPKRSAPQPFWHRWTLTSALFFWSEFGSDVNFKVAQECRFVWITPLLQLRVKKEEHREGQDIRFVHSDSVHSFLSHLFLATVP